MDSREFAEWIAYYGINPWGEERADARAGAVCATTANAWRGKGPALTPADFFPESLGKPKPQQQSVEEMQFRARLALGGMIKHGNAR